MSPPLSYPPSSPSTKLPNLEQSPAFTVVIPAYNCASYIDETLDSVFSQTISDWELIVVDDGSTDATSERVLSHTEDSRVRLISQENQGVSAARNAGARAANGRYIAFLDADDRWHPHKLAAHLHHFQSHPSLGVSFARVRYLSADGVPTRKVAKARLKRLRAEVFLQSNPTVTTSNVVLRRDIFEEVGGFDPAIRYAEDMDYFFRISTQSCWTIEGINQVLVEYRTHDTGLSASLQGMEAGWNRMIDKAIATVPAYTQPHIPLARAVYLRYLARQSLRLGLPSAIGQRYMHRALRSDASLLLREPRRTGLTLLALHLSPWLAACRTACEGIYRTLFRAQSP